MIKSLRRYIAISTLATLTLQVPIQALASDFSTPNWNTGFSVTNSVAVASDGALTVTATWQHSAATLLAANSTLASGSLVLRQRGPMFCDGNLLVAPQLNSYTRPAACMISNPATPAPIDTISGGVMTTVWSIPASDVANFDPDYPFFGLRYEWVDANGTSYWIFSPMEHVGSGISLAAPTSQPQAEPTPAKYSGPEFSGLSAKALMTGSSSRLEGKNLDEISSITIDGKAATFKLDGDKALDLTLPAGLAPGLYDLVINSSAGKLTHINAIRVREPLKSFSITSRSAGKISEEQYQEHALISAMQIPELNKARCVVNAASLAMAKAQAQRLCALVKAANPNIETTVIEARSTVKSDSVFARVSYGWNN